MESQSPNSSSFTEEELDFSCRNCDYDFLEGKHKPFYLSCSSLICGKCVNMAKASEEDFFKCLECNIYYSKEEMKKLNPNREIERIIKMSQRTNFISSKLSIFNLNISEKKKSSMASICKSHKKEHVKNLYCFYHKKKICSDCLIEHQFGKCNIKNWTNQDSELLINELKTNFIKISDLERSFNDSLLEIESKLNDEKEMLRLDLFSDHLNLVNKYNKIIEENTKHQPYLTLYNESFLQSSIELNNFLGICGKLKEKTILSNLNCLRFLTNNFKIQSEMSYVVNTLSTFPNIILHAYNNYNDDTQFFVKYNNDLYSIENNQNEVKLKLIDNNSILFNNSADNLEILLINGLTFRFYDIFIFDSLFQYLNLKNVNNITKTLYYNDKYFVFDFLNFIEINNNYLKITFKSEEQTHNIFIKILKYHSQAEYVVDYYLLDTKPLYYKKTANRAKIRLDDSHFKLFFIEKEIEINKGAVKLYLENKEEICGKVESISYFRIINC